MRTIRKPMTFTNFFCPLKLTDTQTSFEQATIKHLN